MNDLYKVENSFKQLVDNFYELTDKAEAGEVSQEEYNMIGEQLALELRNKSTNIVCYCQNEKAMIEAISTEINRLTELKKSKENHLNNFKEYVKTNMERLDLQKIETALGTLSIIKNPISIEITEEDKIPAQFKEIVQTVKVKKKAISDYFKETGELVKGVRIISDKRSLKIK